MKSISNTNHFIQAIIADNKKIQKDIISLSKQIAQKKTWLLNVKNSKFYKIWQKYNKIKKVFIE